jgi:hypothetical protein
MSSLPPLDAVFMFGSPAVHAWLAELGWKPDWGWNNNFRAADVANAYNRAEAACMPLGGDEAYAMLGGCNSPWPEGDWLELIETPLVLMTFAESEPWIEVFNMGDRFKVIPRIT